MHFFHLLCILVNSVNKVGKNIGYHHIHDIDPVSDDVTGVIEKVY